MILLDELQIYLNQKIFVIMFWNLLVNILFSIKLKIKTILFYI